MFANAKKIMSMEGVKRFVSTELCESYMASYQKLEILQMPMSKATKFLKRLHMNIEGLLLVIF